MSRHLKHLQARNDQSLRAKSANAEFFKLYREAQRFAAKEIAKAEAAEKSLWGRFKAYCKRTWAKVVEYVND